MRENEGKRSSFCMDEYPHRVRSAAPATPVDAEKAAEIVRRWREAWPELNDYFSATPDDGSLVKR